MPQRPQELVKYLSTPLPQLREQYPPGTGGTGPRSDWSEGTLKTVQVIDDFEQQVKDYLSKQTKEPISPHPNHKFPKFLQEISSVPNVLKAPADLQKCLSTLPLAAVGSVLTALDSDPADFEHDQQTGKAIDGAGYESDGGEHAHATAQPLRDQKTKPWQWRFNKSPMGSGEFHLIKRDSEDVKLVVRTINSSAFSAEDWKEYVVSGSYHYDTRSRASWYWSRSWGATKRLGCDYWVLTDWQRWVFGKFDTPKEHGWVSPILNFDSENPSILQALFYWCRSAIGDTNGYKEELKDVSGSEKLFPVNLGRRSSVKGKDASGTRVKRANESDIEESDVEE
ncbi:hypothetical protein BD324DRAFT_491848 [Kockovaella imperatae]|uniref:Uncharacterized protein n=1 Tax=Kockovaella imperatae TaxID=4999 RepID=A0A1Y1UEB6_9TREE|nr:hypothetical protein BD324DRAFT_491848 [Kockovaella imperatae]ORX36378.1 hypothetical protein BD324DRAFT_491848 [Kockovaella imperatae]